MRRKKNGKKKVFIIEIMIFIILVGFAAFIYVKNDGNKEKENTGDEDVASESSDAAAQAQYDLGNGLIVTRVESYSGPYMEDASDEEVSDVMMIYVTNEGEKTIQYAEVVVEGEEEAVFKITTLYPGYTMMALESSRKPYTDVFESISTRNVAYFQEEPNLYRDVLEVQPLDGGFNITNISDEDITGEVVVYFKDVKDDVLWGGITYRGRIEGGIGAGDIRQIMTENFSEDTTKVVFITIAEE